MTIKITQFPDSAFDYKSFLCISGIYVEPQQQPNTIRIMVYVSQTLSLFTGCPFKLPNVLSQKLSDDKAINGSL